MAQEEKLAEQPNPLDFLLNYPLYRHVPIDAERSFIQQLRNMSGHFDLYCPSCGREATFRFPPALPRTPKRANEQEDSRFFEVYAHCTRDYRHRLHFFLESDSDNVEKVGQSPSYGDLLTGDMATELGQLDTNDRREMVKALRLFSSDVAIGAFVYLRRVFERVIDRAHVAGDPIDGWLDKRMHERIDALGNRLPPAVSGNAVVWKILSRGVHELTEEDCQRYFPAMRAAISVILEQELHERRKRDAEAEMKRAVSAVANDLDAKGC